MNYILEESVFPSSDGIHTVHLEVYTPVNVAPIGVIQIAHGMIDYTGRYIELIEYLCKRGYAVGGNHHLGHGKSVTDESDFGYFAESDGLQYLIDDMHEVNRYLHNKFPDIPLILFGHSMGSFISRLYTVKYPNTVKGLVMHGTGGSNPLVGMGITVAKLIRAFYGGRHRSKLIESLAFGSYNKRFPKSEGPDAWLTRDTAQVADRPNDKFTSFKFTVSGYIDLFEALKKSNGKAWYRDYPKDLPSLIISGDADPVGSYGKGPREVYKKLLMAGSANVSLKIYPEARHELFKESNREEVFADLLEWFDGVVK